MKKSIILLSGLLLSFTVFSQNNCKDALFSANQQYEAGQVSQAIETITPCASSLSSKEDQFEAYKLLAISNQELGNTSEMDKYIILMLALKPYYQLYPNGDPSSFTKELKKFSVTPKLRGGITMGTNINNVKLVESHSALNEPQKYNSQIGYQFGVFAKRSLNNNFELGAEFMNGRASIDHEITKTGNWTKNYHENQNYLRLAVSLNKHFQLKNNFNFYVGINAGVNALSKALVSVKSNNLNTESYVVETKDAIEERNTILPNIGLQAGIEYQLERGKLTFEIGYLSFLNNTVKDSERLSDSEFIFETRYVNDDIKLRLTTINFSYSIPLSYFISRSN